ncbi:MAG TPA: hypothetical protein VNJ08_10535 [Bacteriovoracaceae bacterium]|nr:hypothetical protein [Bacteriovoracaceae bacterium]
MNNKIIMKYSLVGLKFLLETLKYVLGIVMMGLIALGYYQAGRFDLFNLEGLKCEPAKTTIEMEMSNEN